MKKKIINIMLGFCFAFLCFFMISRNVKAEEIDSGKCGENVNWSMDDNGTLTISGTGSTYDYNEDEQSAPWYKYTTSYENVAIEKVIIESGITRIGNELFYGCGQLTDISIPESITEIAHYAFGECYNLETINLPENVFCASTAMGNCGIKRIFLPKGFISDVGQNPFVGSTNLEYIEVSSENLTYYTEDGVLYDKTFNSILCYPPSKEGNSFSIPDTISVIGDKAFYRNKYLETIIIPNSIISIWGGSFVNCEKLQTINIPDSVGNDSSISFEGCWELKNVTLSKNLVEIESYMFSDCMKLESITLPTNIKKIGAGAFSNCTNLKKVVIPDSVTEIEEDENEDAVFRWCENVTIYGYTNSYAETYAKKYNIPFISIGVSSGNNDNNENDNNQSELPSENSSPQQPVPSTGSQTTPIKDTAPAVGERINDTRTNAVYTITGNTDDNRTVEYIKPSVQTAKVTIPSVVTIQGKNYQVTAIANKAFKNNKKVKKIMIPSTVKKIGKQAFFNCKKLKNIVIKTKKLKNNSVGKKAFKGISAKAVIKVPKTKQVVYRKILKKKGIIL